METHDNHDWLIKEWTELLEAFKQILNHLERISQEPLAHPVRIHFEKAGKAVLKTLNKIDYPFDISRDYRKKPHGKGDFSRKKGCYNEYWICIVSLFCRKDQKFMEFWDAKDYYLPTAWDYINDDPLYAEKYFMVTEKGSDIVNYDILKDICNASAVLCEYIIMLREKQKLQIVPNDAPENESDKEFEKQIVSYKKKEIRFGGYSTWEMFKLLYEAKGHPVADRVLVPNEDQQTNVVVGELKRYLKKQNAPEIALAITKKNSPGYRLDFDKL